MPHSTDHEHLLYAPDYSEFRFGCGYCGRLLSQVRDTVPMPCYICNCAHYCSPGCLVTHYRRSPEPHRPQCRINLDSEVDVAGMHYPTKANAQWDLRKYGLKFHEEWGDAAIAGLNLYQDPTTMDRSALVVHLNYVPYQPHRTRRFRLSRVDVESLESLAGGTLNGPLCRRATSSMINRNNGMAGCVLIVLTCNVPGVGFIFYSVFVGPEPSVLADPPPQDWQQRLWIQVSENGTR